MFEVGSILQHFSKLLHSFQILIIFYLNYVSPLRTEVRVEFWVKPLNYELEGPGLESRQ
jgi:hypothetical protein